MNIHEHQAKELLKEFNAPISNGIVIYSLEEIDNIKVIPEAKKNLFLMKSIDCNKNKTGIKSLNP